MVKDKKTVFNSDNSGHLKKKYPIFLGDDLGLYDTINIVYPELENLYLLQRSLTWTEDEINLEQSRMDMIPLGKGGKTRPEEVDILIKAVSYLWEADSIASRSVISIFSPFLTNNEATAMMMEQTRFEVIHAKTYSEIVRQCVQDGSKLIAETLKNEEILSRTDTIVKAFNDVVEYGAKYNLGDKTVSMETYREVILRGVFALLLLERVQFMSSFLVVFGLAEHDKFKGIADLVRWIARDEGLHVEMMATIINILKRDDEDWNNTFERLIPTFHQMTKEVYERELQWNSYLFSEGRSMIGLNTEILDEWVKYCVIDMYSKIDLSHDYGTINNPVPWSNNWFEFDKVQNANQESDSTNYRMNAIANDLDEDEIFDI